MMGNIRQVAVSSSSSSSWVRQLSQSRITYLLLIVFTVSFFFCWTSLMAPFSSGKHPREELSEATQAVVSPNLDLNHVQAKIVSDSTANVRSRGTVQMKDAASGQITTLNENMKKDVTAQEVKAKEQSIASANFSAAQDQEKEQKNSNKDDSSPAQPRGRRRKHRDRKTKDNDRKQKNNENAQTPSTVIQNENSAKNNLQEKDGSNSTTDTVSSARRDEENYGNDGNVNVFALPTDKKDPANGSSIEFSGEKGIPEVGFVQNATTVEKQSEKKAEETAQTAASQETSFKNCDIYTGKWVPDNSGVLYDEKDCFYVSGDFNCIANGRPDRDYLKWRWQPNGCDIPRMNATHMLEHLRGKFLMYVGDSLNRGQWESMLCILTNVVPKKKVKLHNREGAIAYLMEDYNATVGFFWAPFLVEQADLVEGDKTKPILKLDSIENNGNAWKDVDVLVFNSGHWWTHGSKASTQDFFQEGGILHHELDTLSAFEKGLETWAKWVDENIDPAKTKVFFRGLSPAHFDSRQWLKNETIQACHAETGPILSDEFLNPYPYGMKIVENTLAKMKVPASLMNITMLSDYRKDAHTGVYGFRNNKPLTQDQINNPRIWSDCSHWCMPGLPDIWNQLLYASLTMDP